LARIALDAMGGDFAPRATIAGALYALAELSDEHVVQLVGQTKVIENQLAQLLKGRPTEDALVRHRISVVDAPDTISMSDKPTAALRNGSQNPMSVGLRLQVEQASDAFVSAGNTGAQMAASALLLGRHAGLTRRAIATLFPTALRPIVVIDSGANVDCSAGELVQFAWLGSVYAESVLGRERPVVGLLSIGEEKEKGNAATKAAHTLFETAGFNFQGNVEGRDIFNGSVDVIVCDGFIGNIALKISEGVAQHIAGMLKEALQSTISSQVGYVLSRKAYKSFRKKIDYSEYGGAPLLGVKGVTVIGHGSSNPLAIKNAVRVATELVRGGVNERIEQELATIPVPVEA